MPQPTAVQPLQQGAGTAAPLAFTAPQPLVLEQALGRVNDRLARLQPAAASRPPLALTLTLQRQPDPGAIPQLGDDSGYRLSVSADGVRLEAAELWGGLAGLETLAQYLSRSEALQAITFEDAPRFPWRGLLLDPARRFLPLSLLKQTVDALAALKLNVLHLHLTDDQGFRFPSRRWPRLTSSQHYQREELEALVSHAAARGVRIVPELDMPGHVTSWVTAYPVLGVNAAAASARFGVHRAALNPLEPLVDQVIEDLLDELIEVFPDHCLHIGGDEVYAPSWEEQDALMARAAALGLKDAGALQAHFTERVVRAVLARARTPVLWDEALHELLEPFGRQLIVCSWRGATARDRALAAGHRVVVASGYYLDLNYPAAWHYAYDPAAPESELLALEDSLQLEPAFASVAAGLRWTEHWRHSTAVATVAGAMDALLGGQACLWGELVNAETLEQRLFSRLPAIAERLWSASPHCDSDALTERLLLCQRYLDGSGLTSLEATLTGRLEALAIPAPWHWLVLLLEPVKWYGRLLGEASLAARLQGTEMPEARPYTVASRLDELIDCLPPESLVTLAQFERLLSPVPDRAGLGRLLRYWRDKLAADDCPEPLSVFAGRLRTLCTQLAHWIEQGEPPALAAVEALAEPQQDLLLAPAFVLVRLLKQQAVGESADP